MNSWKVERQRASSYCPSRIHSQCRLSRHCRRPRSSACCSPSLPSLTDRFGRRADQRVKRTKFLQPEEHHPGPLNEFKMQTTTASTQNLLSTPSEETPPLRLRGNKAKTIQLIKYMNQSMQTYTQYIISPLGRQSPICKRPKSNSPSPSLSSFKRVFEESCRFQLLLNRGNTSCDKTQQDGFAFSIISVFDSCPGSSLTKLLPLAGFEGSIRLEIAGSASLT
jgi:hypothetical protein